MAWTGKRGQFEELVSASLPAALRLAVRLTGRLDTAEEVVQDALLSASRSWKTYRGEARFQTWLFRIVVNTFRDRLARRAEPKTLVEDVIDPGQRSPSDAASAGELSLAVAGCVAQLPVRQREVIVLSVYEGLEAGQIAEVLSMSIENVYSTLSIARAKLRRQLGAYLAEK
jgi:RNA polymerase sigma-70 factor (ECF subfamily)